MNYLNCMRLAGVVVLLGLCAPLSAQTATSEQTYTVFVRARPIGQERVAVMQTADGWVVRGGTQLGPPLDLTTKTAEIHYDREWRPTRMLLEGMARGQAFNIKTTFADGNATSALSQGDTQSTKTDPVSPDVVVLPNAFLGSYAALAQRLVTAKVGDTLRGYIAPQGEVPLRIDGVFDERIETPKEAIAAKRYVLMVSNPAPAGDMPMTVWIDARGTLLRMSIPSQALDLAREDVASAGTRTTSFSIPGDEPARIPAAGFNLAATVTKPSGATGPLPALILIGGSGQGDRDGFVAGIPMLGQIAADLVRGGFFVVRYDKRGVGQSGGRTETATITDYAEDVRAIVTWLEKQRKDVDKKRIGVVGHSEGAWIAMTVAARDKRIAAVAMIAGVGTTGGELVLEQQQHLLKLSGSSDEERQAKIELQRRINEATVKGSGWEGVPDELRNAADTPWFRSFLAFDPARVMRDVRQPVLVVQGELDTQVAPHHADRLADLARSRNRKVPVDVARIPQVNHLLVPAATGEISEYPSLRDKTVSPVATAAIATWMARNMG